jgi:hypothetical protein
MGFNSNSKSPQPGFVDSAAELAAQVTIAGGYRSQHRGISVLGK